MRDLYEVLEISKTATKEEIGKAYRRLARKYHPDANKEEGAVEKFKEVAEAHEILSDDRKRAEYDQFGRVGNGGSQRGPFTHPFEDFFNNMFGGRGPRPQHGSHIQLDCFLTLNELLEDGEKEIKYDQQEFCETCGGAGGKLDDCKHCDGKGYKVIHGQAMTVKAACHACEGSGKSISESCSDCENGLVEGEEKTLVFKYPAGVEDGVRFVFRGRGQPSSHPSGHPGNLYVTVHTEPHEFFSRMNNGNLLLKIPVTFPQLVLGDEVEIPTLEGEVSLKIPAGTDANQKFKLNEMGLPIFKESRSLYNRGDQIVQVVLETPKNPTGRYLELIEEMSKLEGE